MPVIRDTYKIAVSLMDLDQVYDGLVVKTLGGKLSTKEIVKPDVDTPSALVLGDLRICAIAVDVLRMEALRMDGKTIRVFICDLKGKWSRVQNQIPLTSVQGDRVILNPEIFGIKPEDLVVPELGKVELDGPSLFG